MKQASSATMLATASTGIMDIEGPNDVLKEALERVDHLQFTVRDGGTPATQWTNRPMRGGCKGQCSAERADRDCRDDT